jgi:LTXXQ motif family protein
LKRILSYSLTAATLSVSSVALTAADAASDQLAEATPTARIQHWVADHEALLDARLGCLKAVLRLTPDQNQLWEAFEKAARHGAKARRMDDVRQMLENHERISPAEHMDATAGRMARRADELKEISEASKPLYSSLDDTQKRKFELLSREMIMIVSGPMWGKLGADDGVPGCRKIGIE